MPVWKRFQTGRYLFKTPKILLNPPLKNSEEFLGFCKGLKLYRETVHHPGQRPREQSFRTAVGRYRTRNHQLYQQELRQQSQPGLSAKQTAGGRHHASGAPEVRLKKSARVGLRKVPAQSHLKVVYLNLLKVISTLIKGVIRVNMDEKHVLKCKNGYLIVQVTVRMG